MNNKKCFKCKGEVALAQAKGIEGINERWRCLPCLYNISITVGKSIMPFTKLELDKIRDGTKWTSLRSLKYNKYPFEKIKVYVSEGGIREINKGLLYCEITYDIVKSGSFNNFTELITALEKKGFKLPQEFWLYDLRKANFIRNTINEHILNNKPI